MDEIIRIETSTNPHVDIDSVRLKRIGVNLEQEEREIRHHFTIPVITFEKDILKQMILYRKAMILKENDRYQDSGLALTQAIESGEYYDANIRQMCLYELIKMMKKFGINSDIDDLTNMYKDSNTIGKSVLFLLRYNFNDSAKLNKKFVNFIQKEFRFSNDYIGASIFTTKTNITLEIEKRDLPGMDIEHLLILAKSAQPKDHPYDLILKWNGLFPKISPNRYMVLIFKDVFYTTQIAQEYDLHMLFNKSITIIVITIGFILPDELDDFVRSNNGFTIECPNESSIDGALEELKNLIA